MSQLGKDAKLYRGTAGTTAATLMTNVRDLSMPDERGEADTSSRAAGNETVRATMRKVSLEWQMNWDEDDGDFAAILSAYINRSPIALKSISKTAGKGIDADFVVTKCQRNESLRDGITADVVAKPTYVTRYPANV